MMLQFKFLFLLLLSGMSFSLNAQQMVHVVPNPQEVSFRDGGFSLSSSVNVEIYLDDKEEEQFIFEQLQAEFRQSTGQEMSFRTGSTDRNIVIGIQGGSRSFDRLISRHSLEPGEELGQEGYRLLVTTDLILISANSKRGAFYGAQTLKQLVRTERQNAAVPALEIKDWPDLEIRGMMDDISRGPVPTNAYMKQQIERMAEMKVNMLTYYTQDVVKTEGHPAFAPPGGALDIEEWNELADYAKKFHIDLVGNFQSFGHFDQILKHPEYAHLGENGMLLSPAFEESYELLEDIYSEMIPAFHSEYFHINSDETFDLGTGASKAMVDSLGEAVVYANHIRRIHKIITGMGKKVMMWGDIVLKHPEILEILPDDIIMISWNYGDLEDFAPLITPFKEAGYKLLISTGVLNSYSTIPDFNVSKKNIEGFLAEAKKQKAWGMLHTVWDDGGFALFSKDWYGVAYAADQSWNSNPGDLSYESRFNRAVYASQTDGLTDAINALNELAGLKSTEKMNEDIIWDKVIPEKGSRVLINIQDWPKVLDLANTAEEALNSADISLHEADAEYIRNTIAMYKFLAKSRPDIIKASDAYRKAIKIQENKPGKAREELVTAYGLISDVTSELTELKKHYEYLWIKENRVYALDRVTEKFDEQLNAFSEANELLLSAIYEFDKGVSLPDVAEIRLDIRESKGWYFQGWLMIEPIPNPSGAADPGVDHLEDMGGIETTFPNVTEEFYFDDQKYRWKRVNTPYFAKVDLDELHGQSENVVMYAFAHIDIPEDRKVRALAGSSDGIEVFVNGKEVHQNFTEREFELDQDEMFLPLHEGRNHLMIKITNRTGDWAFSFRLPDSEMRSYKNRYKIIE